MIFFCAIIALAVTVLPMTVYESSVKKNYILNLVKNGFHEKVATEIAERRGKKVTLRFYKLYGFCMAILGVTFLIFSLVFEREYIYFFIYLCLGISLMSFIMWLLHYMNREISVNSRRKKRRRKI